MEKEMMVVEKIEEMISQERKVIDEINSLFRNLENVTTSEEKKIIDSQIHVLNNSLSNFGSQIIGLIGKISLSQSLKKVEPLDKKVKETPKSSPIVVPKIKIYHSLDNEKLKPNELEKLTLKRMKMKKKKISDKKEKKPSKYVKISSKFFYNYEMNLIKKGKFRKLKRDLIKSNLEFIPQTYISLIFFTTFISIAVAIFVTIVLLFINISSVPPFISGVEESIGERFLKIWWILFLFPIGTFLLTYFYPSMERKVLENKIDQEIPFATIHMSAISRSMIEPSKIFSIISATGEYPYLEKEFTKLQNEINIYGYDLVTALRNRAFNSPSKKLADLFNGLAITITSGGDLPAFFEKRSQSLLFEHRLNMEKRTKANETFMDIYISVVIAAPMILMLLLVMMNISGLGISLSPFMTTIIMVLVVSILNILFLSFLHLKQPRG